MVTTKAQISLCDTCTAVNIPNYHDYPLQRHFYPKTEESTRIRKIADVSQISKCIGISGSLPVIRCLDQHLLLFAA